MYITENAVKDRQTNADIFRAFIMRFRKIMDNQTSGHKELSMAIQGYGYFAAVSVLAGQIVCVCVCVCVCACACVRACESDCVVLCLCVV